MQNWVKMLESLLDKQKSTQPAASTIPAEQVNQRDTTETPQQPPLWGSESKLQTLLNQYPQISETFKPVEEFLSNYTQMQATYYGDNQKIAPNSWSNNQYQTNPVYPYEQGNYETSNYWKYFSSSNNNNNNNNNGAANAMNYQPYETKPLENNPLNQFFMQAKSGNGEDSQSFNTFAPAPPPQASPPTVQAYSPHVPAIISAYTGTDQTNSYSDATASRGSENAVTPTVRKVRPWPTPRPFQYNLDLLKIYQERALEKQLEEEERKRQKPTVPQVTNLPSKPILQSSNRILVKETAGFNSKINRGPSKNTPDIRIAQFMGNKEQKNPRIHPWPFALRIKVIPPDGGNYIMRIKGPLDALSGSHPKVDAGQGRSGGILMNSQSRQIADQRKYIPPLNRNYKLPPDSYHSQNPIVYLKVPRTHQKFIELMTSFPTKEVANGNGEMTQNRGKVVSLKLPFNVSLATVLKNIYENMFANYLNKRPSEIINEDRQSAMNEVGENMGMRYYSREKENRNLDAMENNLHKMEDFPKYSSLSEANSAELSSIIPKPMPSFTGDSGSWEEEGKSFPALSNRGSSFNIKAQMPSRTGGYVSPLRKMQLQNVNKPSTFAAISKLSPLRNETSMKPRSQSQRQNPLKYQQFKMDEWKNIYQKLKSKITENQKATSQEIQRAPLKRLNQYINSGHLEGRKSPIFPESIRLRLYPQKNLPLNQVTQSLLLSRKQGDSSQKPGKNNNLEDTKRKYYAELVIKNPAQTSNTHRKEASQQWRSSQQLYGNTFKTNNQVTGRMLPFQRSILPINLLGKQQLFQQRKQVQNQYQLSQPLIRQSSSARQIQNIREIAKTLDSNQNGENLLQAKSAKYNTLPTTIKFRQMQIPYKYLVNPVKLGSRWRLVPVTANLAGSRGNKITSPAIKREPVMNLKSISPQSKAYIGQTLPQSVNNKKEQHKSRQLYENQVQILRQLQRQLNMRKSEEKASTRNSLSSSLDENKQRQAYVRTSDGSPEVIQMSARISPLNAGAVTPGGRQGKLGSPLMERLTHGLPTLQKTDSKRPGIVNGGKSEQKFYYKEGKTQRRDHRQGINEDESMSMPKGKPIIVTELAQTRTFGSPPSMLKKEESDSSTILTKFLQETAPNLGVSMSADDWDKRKSIPGQTFDSDVVSKSYIPELTPVPLSDHEIIKEKEHHLKSRLVRLKRKRTDIHNNVAKQLQRSKRL